MLKDMDDDYSKGKISRQEQEQYKKKLYNSIVANDNDSKMVTLCLANFILKILMKILFL